jgi:tetratricopeptide (TPR) repeat protein
LENRIKDSLKYYKRSLSLKKEFETDKRYTTLLMAEKSYLKALRNFESMLNLYKQKERQAQILMEYGKFYINIDKNIAKEKLKASLKLYINLSKIESKEYLEIKKLELILKGFA